MIKYTWDDVSATVPEFVDFIARKHGKVPEGEVNLDQYAEYLAEYAKALG